MDLGIQPWLVLLLGAFATQILKFCLYGIANRRLSLRILVTTSGLPSLYAVAFGCLTTLVGLELGFKSSLFTATFIFSGMVLHDSIRLRGSIDRGGRASLLVAQSVDPDVGNQWLGQMRPFLGDRRHRPLHIVVGLVFGILLGVASGPV
jgi:acid phosphatase family membrane protein YuiD